MWRISRLYQPPWASTTARHGEDSFALFCSRQARICGALPMNCEQNASASARQAIFSCMLGPDWAEACEMPAITTASAMAADFRLMVLVLQDLILNDLILNDLILNDLVMGAPFGVGCVKRAQPRRSQR